MTLMSWTPDPAPFGNATGFDTVALNVLVTIAESLGMAVYRGQFPEDIQGEQERKADAHERVTQAGPLKSVTISHDGLSISGERGSGSSVHGYRSNYWLHEITPETVVFDFRSLPWEQAKSLAIRGPMVDVDLADGLVSKLGPIDRTMAKVADDYMRHVGATLEDTGAEIA